MQRRASTIFVGLLACHSSQAIDTVCHEEEAVECLLRNNHDRGGWLPDPSPDEVYSSKCDIDRIDVISSNFTLQQFLDVYYEKRPVIFQGLQIDWEANENWKRATFHEDYGQSLIKVSADSVVVVGGGSGVSSQTLAQTLDRMADHMRSPKATQQPLVDFTFDPDFLKNLPGIEDDFHIPLFFGQTFNKQSTLQPEFDKLGGSWNMLSLGATRGGLPPHSHGETWLGLVYGMKRWFAWPPEGGVRQTTLRRAGYHPLEGVWQWFKKVYPLLAAGEGGEAPMECVQLPGETLYLPRAWGHATLNIGEAVGAGGQAHYPLPQRRADQEAARKERGDELDVLMGLALGHIDHWENGQLNFEEEKEVMKLTMNTINQAMALAPDQPDVYYMKGQMAGKMYQKHPELAGPLALKVHETVEQGLRRFSRERVPKSVADVAVAGVRHKLAHIYFQFPQDLASAERAEAALRSVLALAPASEGAWRDLAFALFLQDRAEEGASAAREALRLAPGNAPQFNDLLRRVEAMGPRAALGYPPLSAPADLLGQKGQKGLSQQQQYSVSRPAVSNDDISTPPMKSAKKKRKKRKKSMKASSSGSAAGDSRVEL